MCATPACHRVRVMHLALCFQHLVSRVMSDARRRGKPYKDREEAVKMQMQRISETAKCASCGLTNEQLRVRRQRAPWSLPWRLAADNSKYLQIAHRWPEADRTTMANSFLLCALCNGLQGQETWTHKVHASVLRRALGEWTRRGNSPADIAWLLPAYAAAAQELGTVV